MGMMISFAIFILFVIFFYVAIGDDIKVTEPKGEVLKNLEEEVLIEIGDVLITLMVFEDSTSKECIEVNVENLGQADYYTVKDGNGVMIKSEKSGDLVRMEYDESETLFKVYLSNHSFDKIEGGPEECEPRTADFVKFENMVFEENFYSFIQEYNTDYVALKTKLGLSSDYDFKVSFELNNGTVIRGERTVTGSVYVSDVQVEYVNSQADKIGGAVKLTVW